MKFTLPAKWYFYTLYEKLDLLMFANLANI